MLMSDLAHRSLACRTHLNMSKENALYNFFAITIVKKVKQHMPRASKC